MRFTCNLPLLNYEQDFVMSVGKECYCKYYSFHFNFRLSIIICIRYDAMFKCISTICCIYTELPCLAFHKQLVCHFILKCMKRIYV